MEAEQRISGSAQSGGEALPFLLGERSHDASQGKKVCFQLCQGFSLFALKPTTEAWRFGVPFIQWWVLGSQLWLTDRLRLVFPPVSHANVGRESARGCESASMTCVLLHTRRRQKKAKLEAGRLLVARRRPVSLHGSAMSCGRWMPEVSLSIPKRGLNRKGCLNRIG